MSARYPRPAYEREYEAVQRAVKKRETWWATAWIEDPVPLAEGPLPEFPVHLLPPWGSDFVRGVAAATQTPVDLAAMILLGVLSTAMAKKIRVRITPDWFEPTNLYIVISLDSGSGKSAVFREIIQPVFEYQSAERERKRPEVARVISRRQGIEETIRQVQRKVGRLVDKPDEQRRWQKKLDRLHIELDQVPRPILPLFVAEDATPEALASALYDHGERMAVLSPEGGDILQIMDGRYSTSPNIGIYLKGYTGDRTTIHRRDREEILLEPILTLLFTVQPAVISDIVRNQFFRERGLVGRFAFSMPTTKMGHRGFMRPTIPNEVRELYRRRVGELMLAGPVGELSVSPEALEQIHILFARFENELDPVTGNLASMSEWAARMCGTAARIAGLLHFTGEGGTMIAKETMKRAVQLTREYLLPHAMRAYSVMELDEPTASARRLLEVIRRKAWGEFGGRELHQAARGQVRFKQRDNVDQALRVLAKYNYVKPAPWGKDQWAVHPRWRGGEA